MHYNDFLCCFDQLGTSTFFRTSRGLRQEDPLSPFLFIVEMEALNRMLVKVREHNLFQDLSVGKGDVREEVTHFFFTDDVLLFCEPEKKALLSIRCVLMGFQVVLRLNINLTKLELVRLVGAKDQEGLARVLWCNVTKLSIKYLGMPLGANYKDSKTWEPMINRFEQRLAGGKRAYCQKVEDSLL